MVGFLPQVRRQVSVRIPLHIELRCTQFFSRARGLMFRLHPRTTLFIPAFVNPWRKKGGEEKDSARIAVHTCFVFFPIDVYWLDEKKRIIHKETLRPFSFSSSHRAHFLVETKQDLLAADLGDYLVFS